jgi:hypothetical protein
MTFLHWEHQGKAAPVLRASDQEFYSYEKSHWWPLNKKLHVIPVDTEVVTNCLVEKQTSVIRKFIDYYFINC